MSQVSKYPVSEDVYNRIFDIFLTGITKLKTKNQARYFLSEFLTPTEQVMLAKRLTIAFLLTEGYSYRDVSKVLRVSTTTVASVSFRYKYKPKFRKFVDNIASDEKTKKLLLESAENVLKVFSSAGSKSGPWRYLRDEINKKQPKVF